MTDYILPMNGKAFTDFVSVECLFLSTSKVAKWVDRIFPKRPAHAEKAFKENGASCVYYPVTGETKGLLDAITSNAIIYDHNIDVTTPVRDLTTPYSKYCIQALRPAWDFLPATKQMRHQDRQRNEALSILSDLVAWSKYSEAANIQDIIVRAAKVLEANAAKQDGL